MKKILILTILIGSSLIALAQNPSFLKGENRLNIGDTTAYPIFGSFRISESGSGTYKTLEFWIYDVKGREVYYVAQGIPVSDAFSADIVNKMIDHGYIEFMMKHGHVLCNKKGQ